MPAHRDLKGRSATLVEHARWVFAAIVGLGLWFSPINDVEVLTYAVAIITLAFLPTLRWLQSDSQVLPAFEILMLTGVQFYGYPLISGHGAVAAFSVGEIRPAALAMITFQVTANLTYLITPAVKTVPGVLRDALIDDQSSRFVIAGLTSATVFNYLLRYTDYIPYEYGSILRALFFGINTVSVFVALRRWGAGHLPRDQKFWAVANIVIQCILYLRSLYLIEALSLNATAAMAYVSTSRRLPFVQLTLIVPIFALLHAGKPAMRAVYWEGDNAYEQTVTDLPQFFGEWIEQSLEALQRKPETASDGPASLLDRASLFQMMCLVTNVTPTFVPYLDGESYLSIIDQLIPRVVKPDKKSSIDSNRLMAIHYKLSTEEDTYKVSIAFGQIAESYANFSYYGCILLGLFLGFIYKKAATAAVDRPSFSAVGIFMILLSAWALQAEMVMALWAVSLLQAIFCVILLPLLWFKFNGRN